MYCYGFLTTIASSWERLWYDTVYVCYIFCIFFKFNHKYVVVCTSSKSKKNISYDFLNFTSNQKNLSILIFTVHTSSGQHKWIKNRVVRKKTASTHGGSCIRWCGGRIPPCSHTRTSCRAGWSKSARTGSQSRTDLQIIFNF